ATVGIGKSDREVVVFVNIRAERRPLDVSVDLVGDRHEAMADHFQRDRVDGKGPGAFLHGYHPAPMVIRISPSAPTSKRSPGAIRVVEPYSSIKAGPVPAKPGTSAVRS